ncbi:hypothetical protein HPB51_023350 [Rhipicephalus microplus]|uniref:DEAD/DEAH-box helicase domain-containing protein n=1 Tax=Rhipicephalus microplus TaxID=6941 RepID=A0A9J6EJ24_RHIMP|nr:hypothetical protein HPB51_023350 [Rhipicephalus microplus]
MSLWHTWVPNSKPMEAPYVPPSLATEDDKLSSTISTGINLDKYDAVLVEDCDPQFLMSFTSFEELSLLDLLQQKSLRAKYAKLTPVQKYAVNIALASRGVMACAQIGSANTASFRPLILYSLLSYTGPEKPPSCPEETLIAVIPSPACELAIQIMQDTQKYAYDSSRKTALVHERTSLQHQLAVLSRGCDILWLPTVFFYVVITCENTLFS